MPVAEQGRTLEIAQAAMLLPSQEVRALFLDAICGDDDELRQRVEAKLSEAEASPTRSQPVVGLQSTNITNADVGHTHGPDARIDPVPRERMGTIIGGRYTLVAQLGHGGMGTVWLAEQTTPLLRRVAIKLIRPDLVSNRVLSRFEAERQALAMMDHPNIAKVFDAGTTMNGRPFFVMELVEGTSLTEFCDARRLTILQRIELFLQVCRAVQHAHQKGIIHRDLKPSNILVSASDGVPVPKVIDFGLAKAVGTGILGDGSKSSTLGRIVGTPMYMSPEQASGAYPVDTRTDIYSLGVVLYELLSGSTPIEPQLLKNNNKFEDVIRMVCQETAPLPSERSTLAYQVGNIATRRQSDPYSLKRTLQGELDAIISKAMEKEPNSRFNSVAELEAELLRHINHEAIQLLSHSRWYRFRKYVRRNRAWVLVGTAIAIALLVGLASSTWGLVQAIEARDRAIEEAQHSAQQLQDQLRRSSYDASTYSEKLREMQTQLKKTQDELSQLKRKQGEN
jgi:eukaryotic-like serine/threonine-protein kinase